jgi:hypothetical protein
VVGEGGVVGGDADGAEYAVEEDLEAEEVQEALAVSKERSKQGEERGREEWEGEERGREEREGEERGREERGSEERGGEERRRMRRLR